MKYGYEVWNGQAWTNAKSLLLESLAYRAKKPPARRVLWYNVYKYGTMDGPWPSQDIANDNAKAGCVCIYSIDSKIDGTDPVITVV